MPKLYFAKAFNGLDKNEVHYLYKKESNGQLKERLQMVLHSLKGKRTSEIATITCKDRETVLKWLHRWNEKGLEGLKDKEGKGSKPILDKNEIKLMIKWVIERTDSGRTLTCCQISVWVKEQFNKTVSEETIRRILHNENFSWKKPSKINYKADTEEQNDFIEKLSTRLKEENHKRFFFWMK